VDYQKFLERAGSLVECYINLDVIPGEFRKASSTTTTEDAAAQGWKNFTTLRKSGFMPMPVYHQGERRYWLEKMLGEGVEYIGLGGIAASGSSTRKIWLDETFRFICNADGWPVVRVHGFGMTSVSLMLRFPWYSVDSASWGLSSGFGRVYIPRQRDGKYNYLVAPLVLPTSVKAPSDCSSHHTQLGNISRDYVSEFLMSIGLTWEQVSTSRDDRERATLRYFKEFAKYHQYKPYCQKSFFSLPFEHYTNQTAERPDHSVLKRLKIYMGVLWDKGCLGIFREERIVNQLVSFAVVRSCDELIDYITNGTLPGGKKNAQT
jgi:hypothetical protein